MISARDLGWFLAGILCAASAAWLLKPLLTRLNRRTLGAVLRPSFIVGALIVVLAIGVFAWLVSPTPTPTAPTHVGDTDVTAHAAAAAPESGPPQPAGSMNEMLGRLERRLATQGGSDADWELLAQTYDYMGRAADASSARSHHLPATLGSANPKDSASDQAPPQAATAAAEPARLEGEVELADALKSKVPAGLTLFVVAKAVGLPGPPVAVMRTTTGQWPVRFSLDDASAMVPDRKLLTAGAVTVEARVSRSGTATPQPGDFQSAVVAVNAHERKSVRLLIDHVIG